MCELANSTFKKAQASVTDTALEMTEGVTRLAKSNILRVTATRSGNATDNLEKFLVVNEGIEVSSIVHTQSQPFKDSWICELLVVVKNDSK